MEDDEAAPGGRFEPGGELGLQRVHLGGEGRGVGGIGGGVRRIGNCQRRRRGAGDRHAVARVEPDVRVGRAVMVVVMRLGLEGAALAAAEQRETLGLVDVHTLRAGGQCGDLVAEPGGQGGADPEHEVGVLERPRLRGAKGMAMRRGAGRHDQRGFGDALHDARDNRLHRQDVGDHRGRGAGGRDGDGGSEQRGEAGRAHGTLRRDARPIPVAGDPGPG